LDLRSVKKSRKAPVIVKDPATEEIPLTAAPPEPIPPNPPLLQEPPPELLPASRSVSTRGSPNWRLEAVRQVRFLMGQGYRRITAQQQIAGVLGRTVDELQSWERELVQSGDHENELLCSEFAGELLEFLRSGHFTNVPHYRIYGSYLNRSNVAHAATIAKNLRQLSLNDIRAGIKSVRRQRPLS
jgi:hypothetical protein